MRDTRTPGAGDRARLSSDGRMMAQDSMLHPAQRHHEAESHRDGSVARWGGLAGIGGGVLLVVVFAIVAIFVGSEPAGPAGPISRFPEIRVARTVENGLYLAGLVMWVPLALSLFHTLRRTRPASALFGSALNIVGLVVLAAGAIPHVVTSGLSDLYHADGATPDERATLVALWQANQGMFDALLLVGLLVMPVGVILLGLAMRRDPAFGTLVGNVSVALGVVGLAAATVMLVDPLSPASAAGNPNHGPAVKPCFAVLMTSAEPPPIHYGTLRRNFCGRDRKAVVAGATPDLAICSACVRLCTEILTTAGRLDLDE